MCRFVVEYNRYLCGHVIVVRHEAKCRASNCVFSRTHLAGCPEESCQFTCHQEYQPDAIVHWTYPGNCPQCVRDANHN
ncbi:hypothetical protein C8Q77DRAFT_453299 [Trametes polyzona]|nr:hypothetical protein C8Q77DRAFT_453299 [Trametes polyzona]